VTVIEMSILIGALIAGLALGGIFFGGLWVTVRLSLSSATLGLWLLASFMLRTLIALAGIHFVSAGRWQRLIACLLGFMVARLIVARMLRPERLSQCAGHRGDAHAP
jgi:F1F0 ATPase subunit 2